MRPHARRRPLVIASDAKKTPSADADDQREQAGVEVRAQCRPPPAEMTTTPSRQ